MTKDSCCTDKYICPVCDKEKHDQASETLHYEVASKIKKLIAKEVIGSKHHPSKLHYSDVHEIVTDVLVWLAVEEQTFNRQVRYDQKNFDQEMIDDLKKQYDWYVDQAVKRINNKHYNSKFDGDYTPQKSELN